MTWVESHTCRLVGRLGVVLFHTRQLLTLVGVVTTLLANTIRLVPEKEALATKGVTKINLIALSFSPDAKTGGVKLAPKLTQVAFRLVWYCTEAMLDPKASSLIPLYVRSEGMFSIISTESKGTLPVLVKPKS